MLIEQVNTEFKNGDILITRHMFGPQTDAACREVIFKNGGVEINNHWFSWHSFFEVNHYIKIKL